jgi:hypothetical protein
MCPGVATPRGQDKLDHELLLPCPWLDLRLRPKNLEARVDCRACREPFGLLPTRRSSPRTGLTLGPSWEPSPPGGSIVVLAGRATHVPQAAVISGIQRTVTVTRRGLVVWTPAHDLGWRSGPNLHGMQGVNLHWRWQRSSSQMPPVTSLRYCRASRSSVGTSLTRLSECPA